MMCGLVRVQGFVDSVQSVEQWNKEWQGFQRNRSFVEDLSSPTMSPSPLLVTQYMAIVQSLCWGVSENLTNLYIRSFNCTVWVFLPQTHNHNSITSMSSPTQPRENNPPMDNTLAQSTTSFQLTWRHSTPQTFSKTLMKPQIPPKKQLRQQKLLQQQQAKKARRIQQSSIVPQIYYCPSIACANPPPTFVSLLWFQHHVRAHHKLAERQLMQKFKQQLPFACTAAGCFHKSHVRKEAQAHIELDHAQDNEEMVRLLTEVQPTALDLWGAEGHSPSLSLCYHSEFSYSIRWLW